MTVDILTETPDHTIPDDLIWDALTRQPWIPVESLAGTQVGTLTACTRDDTGFHGTLRLSDKDTRKKMRHMTTQGQSPLLGLNYRVTCDLDGTVTRVRVLNAAIVGGKTKNKKEENHVTCKQDA